jgi:hypothetical protein
LIGQSRSLSFFSSWLPFFLRFFYLAGPCYAIKGYWLIDAADFTEALLKLKGNFIICLRDHPQRKTIFENFCIDTLCSCMRNISTLLGTRI